MFYWLIKGLAWPIVRLYLRFRRSDKERVPRKGPCIVVANHSSYLDAICLGSACPRKLHFLISIDIYRMLGLRWLYFLMGTIPLRTDGADTRAMKTALDVLRRGGAIGVFPEGQRMRDGRLGEGKIGVAFLAARSGAPVVPAAIIGAYDAMPVGALVPRPRPVRVAFGDPLEYPEKGRVAGREDLLAFANHVMQAIADLGAPAPRSAGKDPGAPREKGERS